MRVLPFLSACAVVLSFHSFAFAADFYVNPKTGKDVPTAGKTAAKPWKSIGYAIAQATKASSAAHTFHLATGKYGESPGSGAIPLANTTTMSFVGQAAGSTIVAGTFIWGPRNGIQLEALTCNGLTSTTTVATPASIGIKACRMTSASLKASKLGSYAVNISGSRFGSLAIALGTQTKSTLLATMSSFGNGGARIVGNDFTAGSQIRFEDCRFENAAKDGLSALLAQSSLTALRCVFRGAGRYGIDLSSRFGRKNGNLVQIRETTILGCATAAIRTSHNPLGKKHTMFDRITLERSVLSNNGSGLVNSDWSFTIFDSLLANNLGDAIHCSTTLAAHDIRVSRTTLADNLGDAVVLQGFSLSTFRIDNSMLASNRDGISGKLAASTKGLVVESCTIANNLRSGFAASGISSAALNINHTIFAGNTNWLTLPSGLTFQYCLSDKQILKGTGNIKGDPKFSNPYWGMYQLSAGSPAIDAGKASLLTAKTDYEGDARTEPMLSSVAIPDIGADERSHSGLPHVTAAATVPLGMPSPRFSQMSPMRSGSPFSVTLSGPRTADQVLWLMGISERRLAPRLPLPVDLSILGFPGTLLHTSIDWIFAGSRKKNGDATLSMPVPTDTSLRGSSLRLQALVLGKEGLGASPLLRTEVGTAQSIDEDFKGQGQLDQSSSGALWGGGQLLPGKLGGSGIHGRFRADSGKFLRKVNGISYYLWNTDSIQIPFGLTLHGEAWWKKKLGAGKTHLVITNGKLEFSEFVLSATEAVIFRGKSIPEISCIGNMRVDGQIILEVKAATNLSTGGRGSLGAVGSLGGASGGQGGDIPKVTGGSIHGRNGVDVSLPAGHPRLSAAKGTGGQGSKANPTSGKNSSIVYFGTGSFASRMTAAGGGGGSLYSPNGKTLLGTAGFAQNTYTGKPTFPPHNLADVGAPSIPGKAFPVLPVIGTVPDRVLFRIGGSGGGGGGTNPCGSFPSSIIWIPGIGGGAGGGHLHIMAGHALSAGAKASILAKGGAGAAKSDSSTVSASGGGGSGGSILIQSATAPVIAGELNVLGGAGGAVKETTWLEIGSYGGKGGAGMIRLESDPAPVASAFKRFQPAAGQQNVGLLRKIDYSRVTVGTSKWYATRSKTRVTLRNYTLIAKINGKNVTFSDDGKHQKAIQGQPLVLMVQSAMLDPKTGKPSGATSVWSEGEVKPLNSDKNSGNGVRFMIRLDLGVPGAKTIAVQSLSIRY